MLLKFRISIHAPTRGATANSENNFLTLLISIHAPTRGATTTLSRIYLKRRFQSTLPREERRTSDCAQQEKINFNPRSHERSDKGRRPADNETVEFQSTLPREERQINKQGSQAYGIFQSTLPREERRIDGFSLEKPRNFNPRSHERSDSNIAQKICLFLYNTDNKYIIR